MASRLTPATTLLSSLRQRVGVTVTCWPHAAPHAPLPGRRVIATKSRNGLFKNGGDTWIGISPADRPSFSDNVAVAGTLIKGEMVSASESCRKMKVLVDLYSTARFYMAVVIFGNVAWEATSVRRLLFTTWFVGLISLLVINPIAARTREYKLLES